MEHTTVNFRYAICDVILGAFAGYNILMQLWRRIYG